MSFAVLTDTSGNLLNEQIRDYGLQVIPLTYLYDGQEHTCLDTDSFDAEDFYGRIKRGLRVTTSQISPQQYLDFFEPYVSAGQDVIYVAMSSGISGSCNSARIGAEMLREKYPERTVAVIDTRGAALCARLSCGTGAWTRRRPSPSWRSMWRRCSTSLRWTI